MPNRGRSRARLSRIALTAASAFGVAACQDSQETRTEAVVKLCDGSQNRTLSVAVAVDLGRIGGQQILLMENGASFLHVRGDCRYWVDAATTGRYHTGVLGKLEEDLAKDLFYGQWASKGLTRSWGPEPGVFDASPTLFSDGRDRLAISCTSDCPLEGAPAEIPAMWKAVAPWLQRLSDAGEPVTGPLRIVVFDGQTWGPAPYGPNPIPIWPLSWPLSSVAVSYDDSFNLGPGDANVVITDADEVAKVVAIWSEYASGVHGSLAQTMPLFFHDAPGRDVDGGSAADAGVASTRLYAVLIRDTIPLEDEKGLVPAL